MPANGETCSITTNPDIPLDISLPLIEKEEKEYDQLPPDPKRQRLIHGVLIMKEDVRRFLIFKQFYKYLCFFLPELKSKKKYLLFRV
jgi:integrator complex subunit 11